MPKKYQSPKLQIRKDGKRPYYYVRIAVPRITETGVKRIRQREFLGFVDDTTRKEAMKRRAELLEVVNAGRILIQSQIYFRDVVKRFLAVRVPQLGAAAQKRYPGQIALHILPAFGELRMCDIETARIEEWLNAKEKDGLGWWARTGLHGILSAIFTTAKRWKLWDGDNPCAGVRVGKKREVREKRLPSRDDLRNLLAAIVDPVLFIVLIMFGTGLRISEVLGLRWRNIDLDAGTLTVEQRWYRGDLDEPKSQASERTRQLGPLVDDFRRRYPGPHARDRFIFLGDDGHTPPDERDLLRYELRPVLKRLKIYYEGFGWHTFRRLYVTRRQHAGATPFEAQKGAGHTRPDMTMLYTLTDEEREREQVVRMFDWLMEIEGGKPQ